MKQKLRRYLYLTLILILTLAAMPVSAFADIDSYGVDAEWYNFRNNPENNGVTDSSTPVTAEETALKWGVRYGTGWSAAPTPPLILNGKLYIGVGNQILELDRETGKELRRSDEMIGNVGYAMNPLTYADGKLFAQVGNGCIQAVDLETLQCLWYTERIGGQTLCPISYASIDGTGYIYSGTWASETRAGSYFCVTTDDENLTDADDTKGGGKIKSLTWQFTPSEDDEDVTSTPRGFYWAGAYACENYVAVGSDDGDYEGSYTDGACFYTLDPTTGEIIGKIGGIAGDIRTTTVYDSGYLYFGTKGGVLYKVEVSETGELSNPSSIDIKVALDSSGTMMTAAPIVYGDKIYVGVSGSGGQFDADGGHCFCVINNSTGLDEDSVMYTIAIPGYPQAAALASTAYVDEDFNGDGDADGRVYLYFTYNAPPGGIYYCYDTAEQTEYNEDQSGLLFTPPSEMQQYCISTICTDNEGTLYYKNDSCYLMAVEKNPAYLNGITVTGANQEAISWDRNFASTVTDYTLKVPATMETANVTLDMNEGMTATVNGVDYKEGGVQVALEQGDTMVTVVVSKDGYSRTYTLNISMLKAISTLDSMKVGTSNSFSSFLNLTPEFASAVTDYSVDTSDTSGRFWRVWLKATDENSAIEVTGVENVEQINTSNGTPGTDGHDRWNVYKIDDEKTARIRIDVTSEDGQVTTSYNLTLLVPVKVTGIEMSRATASIDVTETLDLDVTVTPSDATVQTVKWYSSDDETAVVDENGKVTPLKAGNVTITAISDEGNSITAKCEVTIEDKAAEVDTLIGEIGTVTLDSKADIDVARAAYNSLTDAQKGRVTKLSDLEAAEAKYQELKDAADKEEADKAAAAAVDEKIAAIGEVTIGSKTAIDEARTAYDALTADQQALVSKLSDLEAAEKEYAEMHLDQVKEDAISEINAYKDMADYRHDQQEELAALIEDAETVIDSAESEEAVNAAVTSAKSEMDKVKTDAQLTEEEKLAEDKTAAAAVDEKIAAIGEVTIGSKIAIDEARTAYDALTADQQALVSKLSDLEAAEAAYEELANGNDDQTDDPGQTGDNGQSGASGTQNNESDSGNDKQDDASTPKTGDDFILLWWIAVLAFASVGLIVFKRES